MKRIERIRNEAARGSWTQPLADARWMLARLDEQAALLRDVLPVIESRQHVADPVYRECECCKTPQVCWPRGEAEPVCYECRRIEWGGRASAALQALDEETTEG